MQTRQEQKNAMCSRDRFDGSGPFVTEREILTSSVLSNPQQDGHP